MKVNYVRGKDVAKGCNQLQIELSADEVIELIQEGELSSEAEEKTKGFGWLDIYLTVKK